MDGDLAFVGATAEGLRQVAAAVGAPGGLEAMQLRIAEQYVRTIPNAEFLIENPGESPLAWRGGSLSAGVLRFLADSGLGPADSEH